MKTKQINGRDIRIGMKLQNEQRDGHKKVINIGPGMMRGSKLISFLNDEFANVFPDDIYLQVI